MKNESAKQDSVTTPSNHHKKRVRRLPRLRGRHVFVLSFVIAFLSMAIWSVASPLFSGPDEPVHVMKAAALVRGQLLGELNPSGEAPSTTPDGAFTLPKYYAVDRKVPTCYHGNPAEPASCLDILHTTTVKYDGPADAEAISAPVQPPPGIRCPYTETPPCATYVAVVYNARYPPLYYAIVGLPSLLGNANWAVYLMRLLSSALSALFLALALTVGFTYSKSRFVVIGVLVAATPMVVYLGSIINPSGIEATAAISTFTSGVVLVREHLHHPPKWLLIVLAFSASFLELIRGLSPFWLACTALSLLLLSNWSGLKAFVRTRSAQIAAIPVIGFGIVAVIWIVKEHTLNLKASPLPVPQSTLSVLEHSFQHNSFYIPGMIGVFGAFDTYSPVATYLIWYGLLGLGIAAVAMMLKRRAVAVLIGLVVATVVLPVLISSSQANKYGYTWSGRDTLPLAVGIPIVAFALLGETPFARFRRRASFVVAIGFLVAQFAAFYEMLRRYTVGTSGSDFSFLLHPSWHPPIRPIVLVLFEAVMLIATAILLPKMIDAGKDTSPAFTELPVEP